MQRTLIDESSVSLRLNGITESTGVRSVLIDESSVSERDRRNDRSAKRIDRRGVGSIAIERAPGSFECADVISIARFGLVPDTPPEFFELLGS